MVQWAQCYKQGLQLGGIPELININNLNGLWIFTNLILNLVQI